MRKNQSGQMMLLAILLVTMLLIVIPVTIWMSQQTERHAVLTQKGVTTQQAMQDTVANLVAQLSTSKNWSDALAGNFNTTYCGRTVVDSKGQSYSIQCSTGAPAASYQMLVTVKSQAVTSGSAAAQTTHLMIGKKSASASLSGNISAAAAVLLNQVPDLGTSGALDVHWGPIVMQSPAVWTLSGPIDVMRHPRKFSVGGLVGSHISAATSKPPISDQKEYWAWSSLGFAPLIDDGYYLSIATRAVSVNPADHSASPSGSASFVAQTTVFDTDANGIAYTPTALNAPVSIYVTGNAVFHNVAIDLKTGSGSNAFVVTRDLTLDSPGVGKTLPDLRVPGSAKLEYPYYPTSPTRIPCSNSMGTTCGSYDTGLSKTGVDFRGFLYVKGNLVVQSGNWLVSGVVRVDGQLIVKDGASLTILYDDEINHTIRTPSLALQVDKCVDNLGTSCGVCAGLIQCDGSCFPNPMNVGSACQSAANSCGQTASGVMTCNGTCSAKPPPSVGGGNCDSAPNECGAVAHGSLDCAGVCTAQMPPVPSNKGSACSSTPNACGQVTPGTINCSGQCTDGAGHAVTPPPDTRHACTSAANACGQTSTGMTGCLGTCLAVPPELPSFYNTPCDSHPNICGTVNHDTIGCDGQCKATTPPNPVNYGAVCNGAENNCHQTLTGTIGCNGCSVTAAPADIALNSTCTTATNNCLQVNTGLMTCNGCNATTPTDVVLNTPCTSQPNNCGRTNSGTIQCNADGTGGCSATQPANDPVGEPCNANSCGIAGGHYVCSGTEALTCTGPVPDTPYHVGVNCNVNACGTVGGTITDACSGACSGPLPDTPYHVGDACNKNDCNIAGGTITNACTGTCSGPKPANIIGSSCLACNDCGSCNSGTKTDCAGTCSVLAPANVIGSDCTACNSCGDCNTGTKQNCAGTCNATAPDERTDYNKDCYPANSCGDSNHGHIQCDGLCSVSKPVERVNYNDDCYPPNDCGHTNHGHILCDMVSCSVAAPVNEKISCASGANICGSVNNGTMNCTSQCESTPGNAIQTPPDPSLPACSGCTDACQCASQNCSNGVCITDVDHAALLNCSPTSCNGNCECSSGHCVSHQCVAATFGDLCNPNICNTYGGNVQCDGTCSGAVPATPYTLGDACNRNACGGTGVVDDACTGHCSQPAPGLYGTAACGDLGCGAGNTNNCTGACDSPAPATVYGTAACGDSGCGAGNTNNCTGDCDSPAPPEDLRAPCSIDCGCGDATTASGTLDCSGSTCNAVCGLCNH